MKLENIGFYTLSDKRAENTSIDSDLQRCELILTSRCNFNCLYCRGIKKDAQGDISLNHAKEIVDIWESGNLKNIRFSGGEPTLWPHLIELVKYTKLKKHIKHIAISTNGSAKIDYYKRLIYAGVNDFSISFDACCSQTADLMAGCDVKFDHLINVIRTLSALTYVTIGIVLNQKNDSELKEIIDLATSLKVSDIRIITSAQSNHHLNFNIKTKYKILKYRLNNLKNNKNIRGLEKFDCHKCHLVKDDMVILNGKHYPCVIYMREQGNPIGAVYGKTIDQIREQRKLWFYRKTTFNDPICKKNCLDFCIAYNNRAQEFIDKY